MPDFQSQSAADVHDCRKEENMNSEKLIILYERLSREDERESESVSIENQKAFLEDYAVKNGYVNFVHMTDDGWSGTRFDRPGFMKMIDEVERGNVLCCITKDMSRLGRDHLRVGLLLEKFRECGVRFIAVNDGVDTDKGMDDFTPFRNIINEWVARDTSRKIRAINNSRTKDGKRVTGAVPYGYLRDPDDKSRWILDEEAAPIVERIFKSIIHGKSITQIAGELTAENVLIPTAHWQKVNAGMRSCPNANPTKWSLGTIIVITQKPEYMGWAVLNKTVKETYKSKRKKSAPEDMLIFKDSHPAIVDEETWNIVQRLRETRRRPERITGEPNPLTGVLYCADCGEKMYHKQGKADQWHKPHHEYVCSSYRHYSRSCTCHYIRVEVVEELILEAIRSVSKYVLQNEAEFIEKVREKSVIHQEAAVREYKKKLTKSKRRREDITGLIKKLYESYAEGKIPEKHFTDLLNGYDTEQSALDKEITELQTAVDNYANDSVRADKFIELVKQHTEFPKFSAALLNEFIEKVVVHEAEKINGVRTMKVDIHLNFIGQFDVSESEEEKALPEKKQPKKPRTEKDREYDRKRYAKIRDARIAAVEAERAEILKGTTYAI
jgi:DNA invertase Pin-like site-specific DNA recombinase/ssDNA-binding Zn-finger/Zn-ribbon topoisomerase 1